MGPKLHRYLLLIGSPLSLVAAVLIGWELVGRVFGFREYIVPTPSSIWVAMSNNAGYLLRNSWITLHETLVGFLVAVVVGVAIAVAITWSTYLQNALYPILLFFQSVPKVAIAPVMVIWFGYGIFPKIIISFLVAFFPIVVNTAAGMVTVDRDLLDLIHSLKATRFQVFRKIRLPNSLPYFFSALKVSITLSLVGAIIGEFVAAEEGLGFAILHAGAYLQTSLQFACFLMLAIMGISLFGIISLLQKLAMPWSLPREEIPARAAAA